jgi:hypothetical protein
MPISDQAKIFESEIWMAIGRWGLEWSGRAASTAALLLRYGNHHSRGAHVVVDGRVSQC